MSGWVMRKISHGHYTRRPVEEARASDGSNKGDITQEAVCEVRLRRRCLCRSPSGFGATGKKKKKGGDRTFRTREDAPDDPPNFDSDSDQHDMRSRLRWILTAQR